MLIQLLFLGCPGFQWPDTGDTDDTSVDPQVDFSIHAQGPFEELCAEGTYPVGGQDLDGDGNEDLTEFNAAGVDPALFLHAAQVLQAKLDKHLGDKAPELQQTCDALRMNVLQNYADKPPAPPLDDCPGLFPQDQQGINNLPPELAPFYRVPDPGQNLLGYAVFENIMVYQWTLTKAMDLVEAQYGPAVPGCWMEYRLIHDAAAGDRSLNQMPAVLYALEEFGTAAVLYTDAAPGSMTFSGADYQIPGPVWNHMQSQGQHFHPAVLLAGYPDDSSYILNLNHADWAIQGTTTMGGAFNTIPSGTGLGIVDPETEPQMRHMDWLIGISLNNVAWDTDPAVEDVLTTGYPGTSSGFPVNHPG
jgi:hypothetical protein